MYKIWIIPGAEKDVSCNLSTYSFSINYYSAILPNTSPWKIAVTSFTEGLIKGMWATAECEQFNWWAKNLLFYWAYLNSLAVGTSSYTFRSVILKSVKNQKWVSFSPECREDPNSPPWSFPGRSENDNFESEILESIKIKVQE